MYDYKTLVEALARYKVAMIGSGAWACAAVRMMAQNTLADDPADDFVDEIKMWVFEEDCEVRPSVRCGLYGSVCTAVTSGSSGTWFAGEKPGVGPRPLRLDREGEKRRGWQECRARVSPGRHAEACAVCGGGLVSSQTRRMGRQASYKRPLRSGGIPRRAA